MKNLLLTCFLALLCLVGRYYTASSKVADSPTEVPLHRSVPSVSPHSGDTHRGGAILPDNFSEIDFGLVDSDQDMGAGKGTSSPLPAPVTVSSFQSSTAKKNDQIPLDSETHRTPVIGHLSAVVDPTPLPSSVSRLPSSPSLVDDATSQGQEEGNTPARVGNYVLTDSLTIGDQIPSGIEFNSILNYDGEAIRLDDYQGKYLILQFWAPTCSASLGFLPRADALTEKYGDRLQILPVTTFPKDKIEPVVASYQSLRDITLPLVVNAQELRDFFPHTIIPHFVVLDPKGKVIAITGMEDMTEANLEKLLNQKDPDFRRKVDNQIQLPSKEKLISGSPQLPSKNIRFQSALTNYIPGVGGSLIQNRDDVTHIRLVNLNLYYHYQLAYSENKIDDYFGLNRIETSGFGEEELTTSKMGLDYTAWMEEGNHVFGYELIAPPNVNPYELMRQDLKRYFPEIEVVVAIKPKMVYALIQLEGKQFPESTTSKRVYKTGINGVEMTHYPLQGFVYHLNAAFLSSSPYPVINLTGIEHPVDLTLRTRLNDVQSLREALNAKGLDLVLREEEIPVLVLKKITDANPLQP